MCGCFFLLVVLQWSGEERKACPRPVELSWEAVLALAGTGDAERGEGGPIWAGTAAPAAGGVPGRPPLLPQLPVGIDPCAEFHLSAQLPTPGEPDEHWVHTHQTTRSLYVYLYPSALHTHNQHTWTCSLHESIICCILYLHNCTDTFAFTSAPEHLQGYILRS